MEIEKIAALSARIIGVISLSLGLFIVLSLIIAYFLPKPVSYHDVYYVINDTIIFGGLFILFGGCMIVFSKPIGRFLSKGLY